MVRRIAVYGATDEALALLPALARRDDLELAWVYDPAARSLRRRLAWIEPGGARLLQQALTDDPRAPERGEAPAVVIDGGLASRAPAGALAPAAAAAQLGLRPEAWREPRAPDAAPGMRPRARPASPLERAIAEGRRFALLRCDVGPAPGAPAGAPAPELLERLRRRVAESLHRALEPRERLVAVGDGSLLALLPLAPGADARARLLELARRTAEQVARELGAAPQRTPLVFGYALHPDEAQRADELLARAARARIRMV